MTTHQAAVIGIHHTALRGGVTDRSVEELIFEATTGALADAGLTIADMDGVVLAASDQTEGRVIESMVAVGPAGGVGLDATTVASSGEHAFVYAYLRILAGQGRKFVVTAWSKPSEGLDPRHAERVAAEPFLLRPLGMDLTVAAGLQASSYAAKYGLDRAAVEAARAARGAASTRRGVEVESGADELVAWPLTVADLPRSVDVACAMVVAAEEAIGDEDSAAWIDGVGWATDGYELADRDLSRFRSLHQAAGRAVSGQAPPDVDVAEVHEISTVGGFAALESLGFCERGAGGSLAAAPWINPSGGNLAADCGFAGGLMRFMEAAQQARGRAGAAQIAARSGRTIGAALHGFAGQGAAVAVFTSGRSAGGAR